MENHHFQWEIHYKWAISIAMLNNQRVTISNQEMQTSATACDSPGAPAHSCSTT